MKSVAPLDYALFQLDSTHTRCELWISAGGVTEKLASGLLKPFLAHLRAAQEQISSGAQSIRLQAPSVTANGRNSGAAWFSKGTMERFVRFVSIPEVLERVSAVETECQRLEEAINILATESADDFDMFNSALRAPPGMKSLDGKGAVRTSEAKKSQQDCHGSTEPTGDTSKRQLLRAMDGRRAMLQKEQKKALAQAVAAGFNMECMPDLVVFADCFGAIQLREACVKFMALRKKIQEYGSLIDEMELAAETVSTGLKMSRSGVILLSSGDSEGTRPACIGVSGKQFDNQSDTGGCFDVMHEKSVLPLADNKKSVDFGASAKLVNTSFISKTGTFGSSDTLKCQVGPAELHSTLKNHARKHSTEKLENGLNYSSECKQIAQKTENFNATVSRKLIVADDLCPFSNMSMEFSSSELPVTVIDTNVIPEKDLRFGKESNSSMEHDPRHVAGRSSSFRKPHIGRPPASQQGVIVIKPSSQTLSSPQEGDSALTAKYKGSEDTDSVKKYEYGLDNSEVRHATKNEHRRLSVQDTISLFESKSKKLTEAQLHKTNGSDELKEFSESGKPSPPVKDVLRRWNTTGDPAPQLESETFKTERSQEVREDNLYAKFLKSSSHDDGDNSDKFQTDDSQKTCKLHSIRERIKDSKSHLEHATEQQLPIQPKLNCEIAAQFDSPCSGQQMLQNSKVSAHVESPDSEMQSSRRWSLAAPSFHASLGKDPVKLDGCNVSVINSVQNNVPLSNKTVVKGALLEKQLPFGEGNKATRGPIAKLVPKNKNLLLGKVSPMEEIHRADDPCDGPSRKTFPDSHPDSVPVSVVPQELSWAAPAIPNAHIQQFETGTSKHFHDYPVENPVPYTSGDLFSGDFTGKGTVRRSWSIPSDFHLEALAKMVGNNDGEEEHVVSGSGNDAKDLQGRLYEQYRQKRDAKLRQESGAKRAERQAKMKTMQEALERRREELTAKNTKLVENNFAMHEDSEGPHNVKSIKAGDFKCQREKDARKQYREDIKLQTQQRSIQGLPVLQQSESTGSTRMGKLADGRQNIVKKVSPVSQKPSSYTTGARPTGNCSPTMSKNPNPTGVHSNQQGESFGNQAKTTGNVLGHSLPSPESRKESVDPLLGQDMHSSHQKKGGSLRGSLYNNDEHLNTDSSPPSNKASPFNSLKKALPHSLMQASESTKGSQNSLLLSDGTQQDGVIVSFEFSAKDRQVDSSSEVTNIALQGDDELKWEPDPGETILQSPSVCNAGKVIYEGEFTDGVEVNYECSNSSSSIMMPLESEEPDDIPSVELEGSFHHAMPHFDTTGSIRPLDRAEEEVCIFYSGDQDASTLPLISSTDPQREKLNPGTGQMLQRFLLHQNHQDSHTQVPKSSLVELEKPPVPTLYALHSKEMLQFSTADLHESSPPQFFSLHGPANIQERIALVEGSPSISASHASRIPRPMSGYNPQAQCSVSPAISIQTDQAQSRKTWSNSKKSIPLSSQHTQKESSKGFKRLLKFGRKSHGSDRSSQDWIAASTSEGDDDGDDSKDYVGEDDIKALGCDSGTIFRTERVCKVTDLDGANGPGSRSFFSLSSFRGKSSDSRLRL